MSDVEFGNLRWLNLLWVAIAVGAFGAYGVWQRRRALRIFASAGVLARLAPRVTWTRGLLRVGLIVLTLVALTAAAIDPRWGEAEQVVSRRGIDVMVLLDVSRSMLARDIAPNRLERAKISIRDDLLPALGGDRIGIVTFAGLPSVKCPLTSDYGFARLVLSEIGTESSPRGGTLIGDAIRKSQRAFDDNLNTNKVVLLITDGEDQESYPVEAARNLWGDAEIPVVAVALGDERQGARIPIETDRGTEYLTHEGEVVWTKADFSTLREIARVSDLNAFVPVGTKNFDLGEIYRDVIVPAVEIRGFEESQRVERPSQYHWFAALALVLLICDSFLRDAGGRRPRVRIAAPGSGEQAA